MIAAFDLATVTGACDGEPGGKPRLWSWDLRDAGQSRPERLYMLRRFLLAYFAERFPRPAPVSHELVVYEAPMRLATMMNVGASEETVALLRGLAGVLEMTCAEWFLPVTSIDPQKARHSVLGWRTAKRGSVKLEVLRGVRALGVKPENDNEADAFVAWQWACNRSNSRLAHLQQPLFRGA